MARLRWISGLALLLVAASAAASERVSIVTEGKAGADWTPASPIVAPAYPPGAEDIGGVCVNMGYYLGEDGVPSEFAVVKSASKFGAHAATPLEHLALFEKTAVATLMQARFVPAQRDKPRPIYTSTTFVFGAQPGADEAALRGRCEVRNLREFLVQARKNADPSTWQTLSWNAEWFKAKNTRIHGLNRE